MGKKENKVIASTAELEVAKYLNQNVVAKYKGKILPRQRLHTINKYLIRIEKGEYGYMVDIIENVTREEDVHKTILYCSSVSILSNWVFTDEDKSATIKED